VSAIDRIAIRRVDVERATVISAQPFAAVVSKLAAAIGHPDMSEFASAVAAARTSADLEAVVNAAIGTAGLMEMAHFDIGEVLRKDMPGAPKALRLVVGNPLIMKEMVKHLIVFECDPRMILDIQRISAPEVRVTLRLPRPDRRGVDCYVS